jgi:hypothetical protein
VRSEATYSFCASAPLRENQQPSTKMNYIKHLTGFFEKVAKDKLVNATHVSLYMALFQFWNCNRFKNPISISRDEVMRISKISAKATYHKCLKALHSQGYINYEPSYNPFRGSHVFMINFADDLKPIPKNEKSASSNFEPSSEQIADKSQSSNVTGHEQVGEQVVVPYINNTNSLNNLNISKGLNKDQPTKKLEEKILDFKIETEIGKEKKLRKKKKEEESTPASKVIPKLEEVVNYFAELNFPESEATKFFNYNNSIGWIIAGKSPITDWKSAANNWILKAPNFLHQERIDRTTHFDTSTTKDYAEPL